MPGPRVFTVDEANALLPDIESAFQRIDDIVERVRQAKTKLSALELIWGRALSESSCPDHQEGADLYRDLKTLQDEVQGVLTDLAALGVEVKDVHEGLIDVYHVHDGQLVFLCWKRGEDDFAAWHHVDEGFAGRQPLQE